MRAVFLYIYELLEEIRTKVPQLYEEYERKIIANHAHCLIYKELLAYLLQFRRGLKTGRAEDEIQEKYITYVVTIHKGILQVSEDSFD